MLSCCVMLCSNRRQLAKAASSLRYLLLSVLCSNIPNAVNLYSRNYCNLSFVIHMVCADRFPKAVFPFLHLQDCRQVLKKVNRLRHLVVCVLCVAMLLQNCFWLLKDHCAFMLCDVVL